VQDYYLYFRTSVDEVVPASGPPVVVPNYAKDTHGDAWDFDEGDDEGIDCWGDKPEFIRHDVRDGILHLEVEGDPYFIWGVMWGSGQQTKRPVRINLGVYPVLEMRVRQNVGSGEWRIYGRPEKSDDLLMHTFQVHGKDWQTVRVDLGNEGWTGILTAFRIDPVKHLKANVEIDWIRLTALRKARRQGVEAFFAGTEAPAQLRLNLPVAQPEVGSVQTATVTVVDKEGRPLSGVPVDLSLRPGCLGELDAARAAPSMKVGIRERRAVTDANGTAVVCYRASRRAGVDADILDARAAFCAVAPVSARVTTLARSAHHYVVSPDRTRVVRPGEPPVTVRAQLADEYGNPVPGSGRKLTWETKGGTLTHTGVETVADGSATATFKGEPDRSWADRIGVRDDTGLAGQSAYLCVLPQGPRKAPVRQTSNGYFAVDGAPWMPLGGFYSNWVQAPTPDQEWDSRLPFTDATDEQTVAWMKALKANGVTACRFMLRTHRRDGMEPMDLGGRVNLDLFAEFLHHFDLARPFGFKYLLVLHEDYTKPVYVNRQPLERYSLPKFQGEDLDALPPPQRKFIRDQDIVPGQKYTDADAIACQDQYTREIIGLLKDFPFVFAYELENEMVNCPVGWVNHNMEVIRSIDPSTPICVSHGGGLRAADPAWWKERTSIDFYSYHLYPAARADLSVPHDYGALIDVLARYGRMGKPAFPGEASGDEFQPGAVDVLTRRYTMRDIIWFSLANGNPGCFFWNARLSEVAEFTRANEVSSRIDWPRFHRKRPSVAVAVPHPLDDDKWFRSQEGMAAHTMMCRYADHYMSRGIPFDFTWETQSYAQVSGLGTFAPMEAPASEQFTIPAGWQLCPLVRADDREALVYIRNCAGVCEYDISVGAKEKLQPLLLRKRKAAPLQVTIPLPGQHAVAVWDLDTGEKREFSTKGDAAIDLGATDHDFVLHVMP
jgi:hypothetical protein